MNISEILGFLEDEGLTEVEEVSCTDEYSVIKFFYDFDNDEIEAAKAYANEESDDEENSDEWYKEWYNPYLLDVANDNVDGIMEDTIDEFEVSLNYKVTEAEIGDTNYVKYLVIVTKDEELDLEEIINEYSE